ncbi:MAG: hypothetical protein JWM47_366 [Acidimicrobiales bacterium]|nr:hypothetical protein [Acidimicrobiales bacterium]
MEATTKARPGGRPTAGPRLSSVPDPTDDATGQLPLRVDPSWEQVPRRSVSLSLVATAPAGEVTILPQDLRAEMTSSLRLLAVVLVPIVILFLIAS